VSIASRRWSAPQSAVGLSGVTCSEVAIAAPRIGSHSHIKLSTTLLPVFPSRPPLKSEVWLGDPLSRELVRGCCVVRNSVWDCFLDWVVFDCFDVFTLIGAKSVVHISTGRAQRAEAGPLPGPEARVSGGHVVNAVVIARRAPLAQ